MKERRPFGASFLEKRIKAARFYRRIRIHTYSTSQKKLKKNGGPGDDGHILQIKDLQA